MILRRSALRGASFLASLFLLLAIGCHAPPTPADARSHSYPAQGVIEAIAPDHRQVTIHHHAIPGYMMEMTMDFPVRNPADLAGLAPGDEIDFTLVVDPENAYVERFRRTGHSDRALHHARSMSDATIPRLKPGDPMPDLELRAEDGRPLHLSDFRGRAVALTFFFTRCPLPTYCPLMNRHFGEARRLLLGASGAPADWQLLSISFDADFDQPQTLAAYAVLFRGADPDRWLFASAAPAALAPFAPRIGLIIMGRDANLTHNLRTLVIDPQGRLYRQFNNNLWTPRELADAILAAARLSASK